MNEQDSRVEVVHGCYAEGGDSILGAFFCDLLRAKLQDNNETSNEFLG